jgi:hypothetical protein
MLTNLRTCSVGDRELAVTPGPLQPTIPSVALGPGVPVAGIGTVASIGAGDAATGASGDAAPGASGDAAPGASSDAATGASGGSALPSYVPAGTVGYLTAEHTSALLRAATGADSLRTAIERLRADIHRSGVRDVVFVVPADSVDEDVATLASVVAPILRANEDEVADLVLDVLKFRAARAGFEQRAARAGSV